MKIWKQQVTNQIFIYDQKLKQFGWIYMPSFLFWNVNKKSLLKNLVRLVLKHKVDVIMLAECNIEPKNVLLALNSKNTEYYYVPQIGCEKIEIFTRFSGEYIPPIYETDRLTIRHLQLPGLLDILLAIVHFPSKLHWSDISQSMECVVLSDSIKKAEKIIGHNRTILVGDINMNPFEDGIVSANGLHGVMSTRIANKNTRIVQAQSYPFFYNPMWRLIGDEINSVPGTYYYSNAEHKVFFWNMFDQVLLRPSLLDYFNPHELTIISTDGIDSFISSDGIPKSDRYSDHLPIFFKIEI